MARRELNTCIDIHASAGRVWQVLTDFAAYPQWNPFVVSAAGAPRQGERLRIRVQPPGTTGSNFTPLVLVAEPGRELRWVGTLPLGSFRGEHFMRLEPLGAERVRFHHGEIFSGWLLPLVWRMQGAAIERGYALMNEAMKQRAESAA
jgi:hypothetical protein